MDRFHLLFHDYRGDRGVIGQCGDFLVAVGEDGFELCRLIGRQVELFAELRRFTLGIMSMMGLCRWGGGGRGWVLLLCKDEATGESQSEGGGEQKAVHGWCSW